MEPVLKVISKRCSRSQFLAVMALGLAFLGASQIWADDPPVSERHGADHPDAGNSIARSYRPAHPIDGLGKINFPITAKDPRSQAIFNQGVAALHDFFFYEAERAFRQVEVWEKGHLMADWGLAMASFMSKGIFHGITTARLNDVAKKFPEAGKSLSDRERLWIEALLALSARAEDGKLRDFTLCHNEFVEKLKKIPDDEESLAFQVYGLYDYVLATKNRDRTLDAETTLNALLAKNPLHPANHYRIHLWDSLKEPPKAMESARRCAASAPASPHMWHMSGHIYNQMQRYLETAWHQEAALRADHAYLAREQVMPYEIHNYFHNAIWLLSTLDNVGDFSGVVALAKNIIEHPAHPVFNPSTNAGTSKSFINIAKSKLLEVLENHQAWDKVLELTQTPYLRTGETFHQDTQRLRLIALAHLYRGEKADLDRIKGELTERLARVAPPEKRDPVEGAPVNKAAAINERLRNAIHTSLAEINLREDILKKDNEAIARNFKTLTALPGPFLFTFEDLALFHFEAGDRAEAEKLIEKLGTEKRNRMPVTAQLSQLLVRLDHKDDARVRLQTLFAQSKKPLADPTPLWKNVFALATELELFPASIRTIETPRLAVPVKKESLGPLKWEPFALGGELTTAHDDTAATLFVFNLGVACLHCDEQLTRLGPEQKALSDLKVRVKVIVNDAPDAVAQIDPAKALQSFSFVADPEGKTFRTLGAYDEFSDKPLHGLMLFTPDGKLLWRDLDSKPFTNFKFLIPEIRRLLQFTGGKN